MTRACALLLLPLLAGCAEPMINDSDVIRMAAEPAYTLDEGGRLMATSCRPDRPSTYSGTPSACQRDVVFAHQVADPADLLRPRVPGRPAAGPIGAAADRYLYGGVQTAPYAAASQSQARRTGAPVPLPVPADGYYPR